eukprot:m.1147860 g.1147860  ORF g.1147860 m.1147860 type:complete len:518 (+) comp24471_c0_seq37:2721-4274(+)
MVESVHPASASTSRNAAVLDPARVSPIAECSLRDQSEMLLKGALLRHEAELAELIHEPFERLKGEDPGTMIDMRPPLLRAKVCEHEYQTMVSQHNLREAMHALISRLAFLTLHFGEEHERVIKARVTLSRAYLDLSHQPEQALAHGLAARSTFDEGKQKHTLENTTRETDHLAADIQLAITSARLGILKRQPDKEIHQELVMRRETIEKELKEAETLCLKLQNSDYQLRLFLAYGDFYRLTGQLEAAYKCFKSSLHILIGDQDETIVGGMALQPSSCATASGAFEAEVVSSRPLVVPPAADAVMVLEVLSALGDVAGARAQHALSVSYHQQARQLAHTVHGSAEVPSLAPFHLAVAQAHVGAGDDDAALVEIECALQCYGDEMAFCMSNFRYGIDDNIPFASEWLLAEDERVRALIRLERYNDASVALARTLGYLQEMHGARSPQVAAHEFLMGNVYLARQKPSTAIKHLRTAVGIFRERYRATNKTRKQAEQLLDSLEHTRDSQRQRRSKPAVFMP